MKVNKFINVLKMTPVNGSTVEALTNLGRTIEVRFEEFLGNKIWEFDYPEDGEDVLAWRYIEYE
jgi:hypothetical protein